MAGLLLDTHALIWFATGDTERMPQATADLISDPNRNVYVSAASIWEIATKTRLGKLRGVEDMALQPGRYIAALGMAALHISPDHAARAGGFETAHRDPFDRMIAAQGQIEVLDIVSLDRALDVFEVTRLWPDR